MSTPKYSDPGRYSHDKCRTHEQLEQADQYKDQDCAETGLSHREPMERPLTYEDLPYAF